MVNTRGRRGAEPGAREPAHLPRQRAGASSVSGLCILVECICLPRQGAGASRAAAPVLDCVSGLACIWRASGVYLACIWHQSWSVRPSCLSIGRASGLSPGLRRAAPPVVHRRPAPVACRVARRRAACCAYMLSMPRCASRPYKACRVARPQRAWRAAGRGAAAPRVFLGKVCKAAADDGLARYRCVKGGGGGGGWPKRRREPVCLGLSPSEEDGQAASTREDTRAHGAAATRARGTRRGSHLSTQASRPDVVCTFATCLCACAST
jgi:hypothetical protein